MDVPATSGDPVAVSTDAESSCVGAPPGPDTPSSLVVVPVLGSEAVPEAASVGTGLCTRGVFVAVRSSSSDEVAESDDLSSDGSWLLGSESLESDVASLADTSADVESSVSAFGFSPLVSLPVSDATVSASSFDSDEDTNVSLSVFRDPAGGSAVPVDSSGVGSLAAANGAVSSVLEDAARAW